MAKKTTKAGEAQDGGLGELSFEDALEELEDLIDRMEAGETGLEDSIRSYERGARLVKRCRELLDSAEQRVRELTPEDLRAEAGEG